MSEIAERADRLVKLNALIKQGINPYPANVTRTHTLKECAEQFDVLLESKKSVSVVGRVRSIRRHGGSTFLVLEDASDRFQVFARKDTVGDDTYALVKDLLDMGDFLQATGVLFNTKTGEKTIEAHTLTIVTKALLPLPEQWHGLSDVEIRYRQRELDLLSNQEVRKRFIIRSKIVSSLRGFLEEQNFLEVETPILQSIPGGANARPFITHHNALNTDFYLRIAPELYLKRLIVGGFEKIYEIGRLFRNEGIDHAHSPEFTEFELYWAYVPTKDFFIDFLEQLLRHCIKSATGSLCVAYKDGTLDFGALWPQKTFRKSILEETGIDINSLKTEQEIISAVEKKNLHIDFSACVGIGEYYDQLFKKTVRSSILQPTWIFDYPVELKPLAKVSPDDPTKSASVQLIVDGAEVVNAYYHELNDPIDQRKRFVEQEELRERGSTEAQFLDQDFLDSLEYGMPPTSGVGMGIDRLVALLTNSPSIKEVILFPTLRRKED